MASKKNRDLTLEIPTELSGLLYRHHDIVLADDSLSDIEVMLLCIYLKENAQNKAGADYDECKKLFVSLGRKEDNFRKIVSFAKKSSLIRGDNRLYLLMGGIKRIRKVLGQVSKSPVYVIKSGENFSAIKLFEDFLLSQTGKGDVMLCDPYISYSTLFPFTVLNSKMESLKILTTNIKDPDKFRDYKNKMYKELCIPIEVRINNRIHDRFILSNDKCWSIGSSIKDFGNKDTIIKEISEVMLSMRDLFQERWNEATLFS